jgi:hypothetical protein
MCGKAVAQGVNTDPLLNTDFVSGVFIDAADGFCLGLNHSEVSYMIKAKEND